MTREASDDIVKRLRLQSRRVAELYGDPEPPDDDLKPADKLWFTAQEAADEIERLRDEIERLRGEVERLHGVVNEAAKIINSVGDGGEITADELRIIALVQKCAAEEP